MWWSKKDDDESALKSPKSSREGRRRPRSAENGQMDTTLAETTAGIEVSLSDEANNDVILGGSLSQTPIILPPPPKVYRAQFSVNQWPVLKEEVAPLHPVKFEAVQLRYTHRVPLMGGNTTDSSISFDDVVSILQLQQVTNERSCVADELARMDAEIEALEEDRNELERKCVQFSSSPQRRTLVVDWDIQRMLARNKLTADERKQLRERRGCCLTVSLSKKALDIFVNKCGVKASCMSSAKMTMKTLPSDVVRIRPENCRDGGAAATIQHVALLTTSNDTALFISRDNGKAFSWGHLPDRLHRRMKDSGMDPHNSSSDLVYLTTGPMGSYFAEFRSGECWWGSAVDDEDFHTFCSTWDIYRVVFGSMTILENAQGLKKLSCSWIILGRDGRAAWKNLPSRLHRKLESQLASEAAPAEVALGCGGSYFVRFMDGTIDYFLPGGIAEVCKIMEMDGSMITNVALHPELSHDFVIRSTTPSADGGKVAEALGR